MVSKADPTADQSSMQIDYSLDLVYQNVSLKAEISDAVSQVRRTSIIINIYAMDESMITTILVFVSICYYK
jgi:hypothetical protein